MWVTFGNVPKFRPMHSITSHMISLLSGIHWGRPRPWEQDMRENVCDGTAGIPQSLHLLRERGRLSRERGWFFPVLTAVIFFEPSMMTRGTVHALSSIWRYHWTHFLMFKIPWNGLKWSFNKDIFKKLHVCYTPGQIGKWWWTVAWCGSLGHSETSAKPHLLNRGKKQELIS